MRSLRPLLLASAVLVVLPFNLSAQRGIASGGMGGRVGGGARGGVPGHVGSAPRAGGVAAARVRPGAVARPAGSMSAAIRANRAVLRTARFRNRPFFRDCFGSFRCRGRFLNSAFLFPFGFFDPFYSDYYSQPAAEPVVSNDNGDSGNLQLAMEVQRLSDQIEDLRQEERRAAAPAQPQGSISAKAPAESTTFIFRDGHRISTENYAIVGDTLWVLNEHTAKKVSLSDLDKPATEQANAANGVDLRLP